MAAQSENQIPETPTPLWQRMALLSLGYFLCAWLGRILSSNGGTVVSYWLPGGLFVSVLLLNKTRDWPWLMAAVVPANAVFDFIHDERPLHWGVIAMFCITNVVQAGAGAWLVRRYVTDKPALRSLREFFGVMLFAGMLASAIGATIAATVLGDFRITNSFPNAWKLIWSGDFMAVLVMAPLILVFFRTPPKLRAHSIKIGRVLELILVLGGLAALSWYMLARGGGINSPKALTLAFVLWVGVRFGRPGAALTTFLFALWMAFLTNHYLQGVPDADKATGTYVFTLQLFVAVASLVGLVPAIVLDERDSAINKLRESEEKFSKAFRASPDGLAISEVATGRFVEINEGYCNLYGFKREEMLGHTSVELGIWQNPQDRERMVADLMKTGGVRNMEVHTRSRLGEPKIIILNGETVEVGGKACFVSVLHDITDRVAAERALHANEETQRKILEMIASGQPMPATLDAFLRMVESQNPGLVCSVLLLDPDGAHIRHGAAPSLPQEFINAINGRGIGPCAGSCGTAAYRQEPVYVADIFSDPLWAEYRQFAVPLGFRACWSTPILDAHRKVLGTFAVYQRQPGLPDERHRQIMSIVTHTAAICISRHREETEREQSIIREQHARIEYTLRLIAGQEAERKRIAAELHDSMGQNLLLIKNLAEMSLKSKEPSQMYEQAGSISHLADQCIAEARRISRDLHPHQLDHLGLKRALEAMIEQTAQASKMEFTAKIEPADDLFKGEDAMNVYRIVQESLNNVLKHSNASHVNVRLERDIHEVLLCIEDDGAGLDVHGAASHKGLGLRNISERVRMLGGKLSLSSSPGKGTKVEVSIPVVEKEP